MSPEGARPVEPSVGREQPTIQVSATRKGGADFRVELSCSPVSLSGMQFTSAAIRDITARTTTEQQLRRTLEELKQLAYVVSHDLNEPLRMVVSYTQLLAKNYAGQLDSNGQEFMAFALDGAKRMQRMIHDLLMYSRLNAREIAAQPLSSEHLLEQAMFTLRSAIDQSRASIEYSSLPEVLGDAGEIKRLFEILLENAIKYHGQDKPHVRVHAALLPAGHFYQFTVEDNGIGIPPKYSERVFALFQRLHTSQEYEGTGVGLAFARRIVEKHGGTIWVESEAGQGSRFHFTLRAAVAEGIARRREETE